VSSPVVISLPRSKSIVIRCLIVHYVKTGALLPVFENDPNDIKIVYNALKTIDLQKKNRVGERCVIDVEDCGAAYRFLMPLLAATSGNWLLTGTPRLLERPILPLVNFLNTHGANIEKISSGWKIQGRVFQIKEIDIDAGESSQFVSAVMMLQAESRMHECNILNSQNPYIRMTERILQIAANRDAIYGVSTFSDWSAAAFWIANAALAPNAHYLLNDLHFDKLQGDASIAILAAQWGIHISENKLGIEVRQIHKLEVSKQSIDVSNTPDLAMILATLAVCYPFELTLSGVQTLNFKESNRLDIMVAELSKFTTIEKHSENAITIYKRNTALPTEFHFNSYNDHRFVMAWMLFKNYGNVHINNYDCVRKSYPDF